MYKYPVYEKFDSHRITANDAVTALLAGSRIAVNTLQLTSGSEATLATIFPRVDHIKRLNLRSDRASEIIIDAENHLAILAIPYVQSLQEDHVRESLKLLHSEGIPVVDQQGVRVSISGLNASNLHEVFYQTYNSYSGNSNAMNVNRNSKLEIFHLLRIVRNENIHSGGRYTQKIVNKVSQLSPDAVAYWKKVNQGDSPSLMRGNSGEIKLSAGHIFTAFGVIKELGRDVNECMGEMLSPEYFAKIVLREYNGSTKKPKNSDQWKKGLIRWSTYQCPEAIPALEAVARSEGYWDRTSW